MGLIEECNNKKILPMGLGPVYFIFGDLGKIINSQIDMAPAIVDEKLTISAYVSERKIPNFDFLGIISPIQKNEKTTSYDISNKTVSYIKTLLTLKYGSVAAYQEVGKFDFDIDGKVSIPGPVFRKPGLADFITFDGGIPAIDIFERLRISSKELQHQFQKSTRFMDIALSNFDEMNRFVAFWTALEIICGK